MLVTKQNRTDHLRSQNRFYVAGWVASELGEQPQKFTGSNTKFKEYHESYMVGYSDQYANAESLGAQGVGC